MFERLVASADAVFSNLRGDQAERLGLTYDRLGEINPAIVCVALTGYGRVGAVRPLPGLRRADPGRGGLGVADRGAGRGADQERPLAGGLHRRADRRAGADGRRSSMLAGPAAVATSTPTCTTRRWRCSAIPRPGSCRSGFVTERKPMSAHPSVVPFQFFATADGHLAIAAPKEKFFRALVAAMDLPEVGEDPRFADFESRDRHREALLDDPHQAIRRGDHRRLARAPARAGPDRPRPLADAGARPRRAARAGTCSPSTPTRRSGRSARSGCR